jgi:hypothetical protein
MFHWSAACAEVQNHVCVHLRFKSLFVFIRVHSRFRFLSALRLRVVRVHSRIRFCLPSGATHSNWAT